jgi:O-succinylbenzoate synthase
MNIERIEMRHVSMPLVAPFETSFGVERDRDAIILRLDSEGMVGWGECVAGGWPGYSYETVQTAWHILKDHLSPLVLGQDVLDVADYRRRIAHLKGHPLAKAGLELALWDLLTRASGQSLMAALGGERDRVAVGVSIGIQPTAAKLVEVVGSFVEAGYPRVKLKIKPGRDVSDVRAVRQAFPDLPLQVDANSAYELSDAEVFEAMDDLGLILIEQPLAEDDLVDHAKLQERLATPICLDESILSTRHARQALEIGACRVINIKPARVGGLSEAVAIHDLCWAQEIPVWCGGMLETGIGRAANLALASLPGFSLPGDISATDRYYHEDIAQPPFVLENGTIKVPKRSGLGVEVAQDVLDRVTVRSKLLEPDGAR